MPRIRSIKPGFFTSEDVSVLPLRARLTWIGLWTHCDDHGRAKDNVKLIKAAVWPLDDVGLRDIEEDLAVLANYGRIVRYTVADQNYLAVTNWHDHQSPNRPSKAHLPPPPEVTHTAHVPLSESTVNAHVRLTSGGEGRGTEGRGGEIARELDRPPPPRRPTHSTADQRVAQGITLAERLEAQGM